MTEIINGGDRSSSRDNILLRCQLMAKYYDKKKDDPNWGEFLEDNDVGIPLSVEYAWSDKEVSDITPEERVFINETWEVFCFIAGYDADMNDYELEDEIVECDP